MNNTLDERSFLAALQAMGLEITSDSCSGWGYSWNGETDDWTGPYLTPFDAIQAAFDDAKEARQFRVEYSWLLLAQRGDLLRYDDDKPGNASGWLPLAKAPTLDEETMALTLVQEIHKSCVSGKLQEGRIAHIQLNRILDRWLKNVIDRWVAEQEQEREHS